MVIHLREAASIKAPQNFRLKPTQTILLSFVLMIGIGTFLLMLPVSTQDEAGLFSLIRRMIIYTFAVEGIFALLLTWHFYPEFGFPGYAAADLPLCRR